MFRKLFIALSIAAITAFLTPQVALAEMDQDQRGSDLSSPCQRQVLADDFGDQRASNSWSPCQLQGLRDDFHDQRASDFWPWSSCQLQGLADDFRDQRASGSWSICQLQGLPDDFRDQRASAPWAPCQLQRPADDFHDQRASAVLLPGSAGDYAPFKFHSLPRQYQMPIRVPRKIFKVSITLTHVAGGNRAPPASRRRPDLGSRHS